MTEQTRAERIEAANRRAKEIINQSWLDAGYSQEWLDESEEITDIFDRVMGSGCPEAVVRAIWEADYPNNAALYRRLWPLAESLFSPTDSMMATILYRVARDCEERCQFETAAGLYARVLKIQEQSSGPVSPRMADVRDRYAAALRASGWNREADETARQPQLLAA